MFFTIIWGVIKLFLLHLMGFDEDNLFSFILLGYQQAPFIVDKNT